MNVGKGGVINKCVPLLCSFVSLVYSKFFFVVVSVLVFLHIICVHLCVLSPSLYVHMYLKIKMSVLCVVCVVCCIHVRVHVLDL